MRATMKLMTQIYRDHFSAYGSSLEGALVLGYEIGIVYAVI